MLNTVKDQLCSLLKIGSSPLLGTHGRENFFYKKLKTTFYVKGSLWTKISCNCCIESLSMRLHSQDLMWVAKSRNLHEMFLQHWVQNPLRMRKAGICCFLNGDKHKGQLRGQRCSPPSSQALLWWAMSSAPLVHSPSSSSSLTPFLLF